MTNEKPYLSTASSGLIQGHIFEFGHANEDKLHVYLRLWKIKDIILEHDRIGNEHLRGELICNIPLSYEESESIARSFHSAQAALAYEIDKEINKEMKRLKYAYPV